MASPSTIRQGQRDLATLSAGAIATLLTSFMHIEDPEVVAAIQTLAIIFFHRTIPDVASRKK